MYIRLKEYEEELIEHLNGFSAGMSGYSQAAERAFWAKKGDKVHFVEYGGTIAIVPLSKNAIKESAGMLKGETSLPAALLKSRQDDAVKGR